MKSWQLEDPYAIIFHIGDWRERGVWGRLFRKELQITELEIRKVSKNEVKWVEKGHLGVWGPSYGSELRSECNGMRPGAENGQNKIKKRQKPKKIMKIRDFPYFPIGPYWSL